MCKVKASLPIHWIRQEASVARDKFGEQFLLFSELAREHKRVLLRPHDIGNTARCINGLSRSFGGYQRLLGVQVRDGRNMLDSVAKLGYGRCTAGRCTAETHAGGQAGRTLGFPLRLGRLWIES
mmetsp:Transcript_6406/g.19427  ORF Transcript_6406/g.19427 Transcript_6406/m.19427 type:complete len:124 (+) Transcript_6406:1290-1661(+)